MTANEIPANHPNSAAAAQTAIDEANALRNAHADDYSETGMVHAGVAAQLAAAKSSLAIAEAIRELTAAVRDRPTP